MVEQLTKRLPESSAQAREAKAAILSAIAGLGGGDPDSLLFAVDDGIRERLIQVRTEAIQFLTSAAIGLPELRTHEVAAETDAFELAMELYGDASRWEELVRRNGIRHPLLIPAGSTVEYIEAA
jgi:prophage DNA circulation protein